MKARTLWIWTAVHVAITLSVVGSAGTSMDHAISFGATAALGLILLLTAALTLLSWIDDRAGLPIGKH